MSGPLPDDGERVLDASVLLAVIKREVGVDDVVLERAVVSAVNWSETIQKLHQVDHWVEGMGAMLVARLPFRRSPIGYAVHRVSVAVLVSLRSVLGR